MMICFFHKKKIINFSSSSLRSRAYFLLTPKHVQRQLLKTALQMRMSGNAQSRSSACLAVSALTGHSGGTRSELRWRRL